jgi:hypothetical protein
MVPCFAILQGSLTLGAAHWLAQEMNFVICYLPCFREWLITRLLLAFLPFQHLFTDISAEISSLPFPLSLVTFSDPAPSAVC